MPRKYTKKAPANQIDAKDWIAPAPTVISAPYSELWGARLENFGTTDPAAFEQKLGAMDKADLQNTCIKLGLMPHDNRDTMKERIMKQFRIHIAAKTIPAVNPRTEPVKESPELEKFRAFMKSTW